MVYLSNSAFVGSSVVLLAIALSIGIALFILFILVCVSIINIRKTQDQRLYNEIQIRDALEYQNKLSTHIDTVHVEILKQITALNSKIDTINKTEKHDSRS